jgi:peptidoglycan-N-acetylglucosamine deacetylase
MEFMKEKLLLISIALSLFAPAFTPATEAREQVASKVIHREIAITFDDLPGVQMAGWSCSSKAFEDVNRKLIATLTANKIPALGLVVESRLCKENQNELTRLLSLWLDAGLELGNHSFSHFDLNTTSLARYQSDVIRGEATTQRLLRERGRKLKYFRHPYLHAGKDMETKRAFEKFLFERGYQIAPVTIDNQEWVFAEVYARALQRRDRVTAERVGAGYIAYMEEMFDFFEKLSIEVVGYEIKQVLLLHDNLLNADYLGELVQMMRKRGYAFVGLEQVLKDPAYGLPDNYAGPQGLSWLHRWSISKGMKMKEEPREPQWIREMFEAR